MRGGGVGGVSLEFDTLQKIFFGFGSQSLPERERERERETQTFNGRFSNIPSIFFEERERERDMAQTDSEVDIGFEISRAFALMDQGKAYASDNNYRDAGEKFQETISVLMAVRFFFAKFEIFLNFFL
jgi:hypothetical protein